jgi:hypothetical protein
MVTLKDDHCLFCSLIVYYTHETKVKKWAEFESLNREYLWFYGSGIMNSPGMQSKKKFNQHTEANVHDHSCFTASMCCTLCRALPIRVDHRCMVRGALLHDYFLV